MTVTSDLNQIKINGDCTTKLMPRVVAAMHKTVAVKEFQDFTLDFSKCTAAYPGSMLAIIAQAQRYMKDGIDIDLVLPTDLKLNTLFLNTNWASMIDFRHYPESRYRGRRQVPAMKFSDGSEQHNSVDKILGILLGALEGFDRSHLQGIEWSLNELTDNVINHSMSPVGGFVQVTNFSTRNKRVEFSISDAGIGIPSSLRGGQHPELINDAEALDKAIRESITRDTKFGQGNGLYGSWQICQLSRGRFEIYSGYGSLISSQQHGLHVRNETIPFSGTLVVASIGYEESLDIGEALKFKGRKTEPVDIIEVRYAEDENGNIRFALAAESGGFGSRESGKVVRNKLRNLARLTIDGQIIIDFADIALVSSSFADEAFGKLFVEIGPIQFGRRFDFQNVDALVQNLLDRAILQRSMGPQ